MGCWSRTYTVGCSARHEGGNSDCVNVQAALVQVCAHTSHDKKSVSGAAEEAAPLRSRLLRCMSGDNSLIHPE